MSVAEQTPDPAGRSHGEYVVVARRYRPRLFEELVGQEHVAQALTNAIKTNRVGHAYLFTGARGVGKTSTARIFAKALNDPAGPTPTPDGQSDIAQSIDSGEDVDVLEIDGASNRGIDEIRQLRSNVNIRPSRARFKIYIIDEVHMLTTPAFNALLKTLEEPPEHVKFILCTTDPEKIPITVLSRCQRFDFAPVQANSIVGRLRYIVDQEKVQAEDEALQMLARRASGSMRDSQSLLEQLLSFCGDQITIEHVHAMLGTARSGRLAAMAEHVVRRDAAAALRELDTAVSEGVDLGQFAEQFLGYLRDTMAVLVGCDAEMLLHSSPQDFPQVREAGQRLGLETLLAAVQIMDHALVRMRQSTHARTLVETALVRICKLEDLDELAGLIAQVERGVTPAPAVPRPREPAAPAAEGSAGSAAEPMAKKKTEPVAVPPPVETPSPEKSKDFSANSDADAWKQAVEQLEDMTSDILRQASRFASCAPNRMVVTFPAGYTLSKETCERPDRKAQIEQALTEAAGRPMRVEFEVEVERVQTPNPVRPATNMRQMQRDLEQHPLVQDTIKLFDAEVIRFDPPRNQR